MRYVSLALAFCLFATAAQAQGALANFPDQILGQFSGVAGGWIPILTGYGRTLFNILIVISTAVRLGRLALRAATMEDFVAEIIEIIMFAGFGVVVLNNGAVWLKDVIDSFRQAGGVAGGVGISPSDILNAGFDIATQVWKRISIWDPAASTGIILVALLILGCIGFIVGCMVVALVQTILYIPIAMLVAGFLGSSWTQPMALAMLMQSIALGAKLMALELMAGAALTFIRSMIGVTADFTAPVVGAVIVACLILAFMIKVIPDWIAGVLGGSGIGEAGLVSRGAGAAVGAAGAGAAVAVGVPAVAIQAGRLAGTQLASSMSAGTAPQSGFGRAASVAGNTAMNIGSAAMADVGRRMSGQGGRHGIAGGRMAADLGQRRRLMQDDMNKP